MGDYLSDAVIVGLKEAHNVLMERKSAEFRECFLREAPLGESGPIAAVRLDDSSAELLGTWEGAELDAILNDVHLIPTRDDVGVNQCFGGFQITTGAFHAGWRGIYLSTTSDVGFFQFNLSSNGEVESGTISPSSCRALKRRIWAQYGAKLRALHILPPQ